jgi:hypothetical protein
MAETEGLSARHTRRRFYWEIRAESRRSNDF